jgi:hypothetical protein
VGNLAITARLKEGVLGAGVRFRLVEFQPSSSYATGGESVNTADLGLSSILGMDLMGQNTTSMAHTPRYDSQANKIYIETAGSQVSNATNLSTHRYQFFVIGT